MSNRSHTNTNGTLTLFTPVLQASPAINIAENVIMDEVAGESAGKLVRLCRATKHTVGRQNVVISALLLDLFLLNSSLEENFRNNVHAVDEMREQAVNSNSDSDSDSDSDAVKSSRLPLPELFTVFKAFMDSRAELLSYSTNPNISILTLIGKLTIDDLTSLSFLLGNSPLSNILKKSLVKEDKEKNLRDALLKKQEQPETQESEVITECANTLKESLLAVVEADADADAKIEMDTANINVDGLIPLLAFWLRCGEVPCYQEARQHGEGQQKSDTSEFEHELGAAPSSVTP
jgi:hypothetical protein